MQKRKHITTTIQYLVIVMCLLFVVEIVHAQDYKEKLTQDSIKISYKWQKDKRLKKDSSYVLMLQIENLSSSEAIVSFDVQFYWKSQWHSSNELKGFCIKSGGGIKGGNRDLTFCSPVFTLNDHLDPMFSWVIDNFELRKKNCACDPILKTIPKPTYPYID